MIETCSIDISCTVDIFVNFSFMYICFGNLNLLLSLFLHFANYCSVRFKSFPVYHAIGLSFPIVYKSYHIVLCLATASLDLEPDLISMREDDITVSCGT